MSQEQEDRLFWDYLESVRRLELPTPNEERALLEHARTGDTDARARVIEGSLELAALLAWKLRPDGWRAADAVQEANLLLISLVDDPAIDNPALRLADAINGFFRG
ncbi:MAG TPA: hypothetical protein VH986_13810 [Acidimicrobiia bacterium]